ncbi:uncharacterized protein LOC117112952 [Anneissia japonica]|uniref:uncharacterized protein LOC117112952 n=1 Tax=Anneissia japonica TaxID=1529436 RepID=UPI0014257D16|nr:uncharacterized protein LOC117112952 [Anneissia japonica]
MYAVRYYAPDDLVENMIKSASVENLEQQSLNMGFNILHDLTAGARPVSATRRVLEKTNKMINTQNIEGWTPLHNILNERRFSYKEHRELAVCLLAYGASLSLKNKWRRTPLDEYDDNKCQEYEETTRSNKKKELKELLKELSIPSQILARGPEAVKAFEDALRNGTITVVNSRLMFLGKEGSGKTSCVKAMLGKEFDHHEPSTVGIVTTTVFQTVGKDYDKWEEQNNMDVYDQTKQILEYGIAADVAKKLKQPNSERKTSEFVSGVEISSSSSSVASTSAVIHLPEDFMTWAQKQRRIKGYPRTDNFGVPLANFDCTISRNLSGEKPVSQDTGVSTSQLKTLRKKVIESFANKSSEPRDITCIWDYAGQLKYYLTHRFFLTDGSYGVVFSLIDDLDKFAEPRDLHTGPFEMTNLQLNVFWLKSIYEHTPEFKRDWRQLNEEGILTELLARHLWKKELKESEDADDVVFEDFIEIMKMFGLLFEKKNKSKEDPRLFIVPSRMKTKTNDNLEIKKDEEKTVSIYVMPEVFLPDAVYNILVVGFVNLSQDKGCYYDPKLFQNQTKIGFDDKHYLSLGWISIDKKQSLKLEISRMKERDENGADKPACKPDPSVCNEVLNVLKKHLDELYPSKRIVGYALKILCLVCLNQEKPHFQELEKCLKGNMICDKTGEPIAMLTAEVQNQFKSDLPVNKRKKLETCDNTDEEKGSADDLPVNKRKKLKTCDNTDEERGSADALSDKEFSVLKTEVSQWYDSYERLPMLKVLFRDKVDSCELSPVILTMDLLNILFARGHLSSQNFGILCDTISITKQLGLLPKIKEKLPSFPDVEEGTISKMCIRDRHAQVGRYTYTVKHIKQVELDVFCFICKHINQLNQLL